MIQVKLNIFRFNAKTDYLPYYKNYEVAISLDKTLFDLLAEVKKQDVLFDFPEDEFACVKLNNHTISIKKDMQSISKKLGTKLTIEPLCTKRATKDLVINSENFDATFSLIEQFTNENDKKKFQEYRRFYYASEMLDFNEDFQGTSLFLFVDDLISKNDSHKKQLLKVISCEKNGIWYHLPLSHKTFPTSKNVEATIIRLKKEILASNIALQQTF